MASTSARAHLYSCLPAATHTRQMRVAFSYSTAAMHQSSQNRPADSVTTSATDSSKLCTPCKSAAAFESTPLPLAHLPAAPPLTTRSTTYKAPQFTLAAALPVQHLSTWSIRALRRCEWPLHALSYTGPHAHLLLTVFMVKGDGLSDSASVCAHVQFGTKPAAI